MVLTLVRYEIPTQKVRIKGCSAFPVSHSHIKLWSSKTVIRFFLIMTCINLQSKPAKQTRCLHIHFNNHVLNISKKSLPNMFIDKYWLVLEPSSSGITMTSRLCLLTDVSFCSEAFLDSQVSFRDLLKPVFDKSWR